MPRAIWSGSINFGLISIPVKLYSAISDKSVRFNQIDRRNGARVRMQRVNAETGEVVPYAEIIKGYEVAKDTYVTLTEEELADFAPEATHSIDLECFVDLADIDPIYYEGAYHVAPAAAPKPYALLVKAMEAADKVAIARFVMRSKEYLAALRPRDGALLLSMLVYEEELVGQDEIGGFEAIADVTVDKKEVVMAESLIASLSETFDPDHFHNSYRDKVLKLIEAKTSGVELVKDTTPAPKGDAVVDLMAALEASVAAAKANRAQHADGASNTAEVKPVRKQQSA
jgi:DNA end-binding protein Ku